jgi:uncharacterized membrane protein
MSSQEAGDEVDRYKRRYERFIRTAVHVYSWMTAECSIEQGDEITQDVKVELEKPCEPTYAKWEDIMRNRRQ